MEGTLVRHSWKPRDYPRATPNVAETTLFRYSVKCCVIPQDCTLCLGWKNATISGKIPIKHGKPSCGEYIHAIYRVYARPFKRGSLKSCANTRKNLPRACVYEAAIALLISKVGIVSKMVIFALKAVLPTYYEGKTWQYKYGCQPLLIL